MNFMSVDTAGTTGYGSYPVTAGTQSMSVYLKGKWGGTFNKINAMVLYKFSLINGEHLKQKAMATLKKAMCHLQRLSERTPFYGEATV